MKTGTRAKAMCQISTRAVDWWIKKIRLTLWFKTWCKSSTLHMPWYRFVHLLISVMAMHKSLLDAIVWLNDSTSPNLIHLMKSNGPVLRDNVLLLHEPGCKKIDNSRCNRSPIAARVLCRVTYYVWFQEYEYVCYRASTQWPQLFTWTLCANLAAEWPQIRPYPNQRATVRANEPNTESASL